MQLSFKLHRWVWLVPVLLLAHTIFITNLITTSLWADEGWTIAASAAADPAAVVTEWVAEDVHPPLFFMALNVWRGFTGDTIFELRYFSVLLSLVGVAVAYRLGRSLFDWRAGVFAALFYALHDLVRVLTQEVRHYPAQMLLVTLVVWLYWRYYRRPARASLAAFVVAGVALLYTHYWGALVLLALALHALLTRRREIHRFAVAFGVIGVLYLPWLPVIYNQITLERPGGLPHALENNSTVYAVLTYQLLGIPELFWVVLAAVGVMGAFGAKPLRWHPSPATLAPLLVAVVVPALSLLLNAVYPTLSFRALAVVVPAVIVLAAHGLSQFRARERSALLAFVLLFSLSTTSAGPVLRAPWPGVSEYLIHHSDDTDVVLLELDTDEYIVAYYLDQFDFWTDYAHSETYRFRHPDDYDAFLDRTLAGKNGVWVAKLGWPGVPDEYDIRPDLYARGWVQTTPEIEQFGVYIDRPILLWRLERPPEAAPIARYGDEMRLLRAETDLTPDGVTVNTLWLPSAPPREEYTISVLLFDETGAVVTSLDSRPMANAASTSTWAADEHYADSKFLPGALPPGAYQVGVQVYYFTDSDFTQIEHAPAADCSDDPACRYVIVDTFTVLENKSEMFSR
jgi:hypothetical protein